jgi:hypothetical protein
LNPGTTIQNLERAYKEAKAVLQRFAVNRQPTPQRPTTANTTTKPQKKEEDMTTREVASVVLRKHGIAVPSDW